jgi:hypothetical protein
MPLKPMPIQERFWRHADKSGDCWLWTAHRVPNGYGKFMLRGAGMWAHRIAWELTHGPIPSGMHVCHRCDVPSCVNPAHLFLGTATDNQRDSVAKGRHIRGERVGGHRLSENDVKQIRAMRGLLTQGQIAANCGVSQTLVSAVLRGKVWAHVVGTS